MSGAPCIVVVDDSEDHRFITVTELKRLKIPKLRIEEASHGDEALRVLEGLGKGDRPILVLSDYRMPRMGGVELVRSIRSQFKAGPIRIVVYSSTDQGTRDESTTAGADEFLVKPMDLDDFRKELRRLVERWLESAPTPRSAPKPR